jgi:hypothetical protein
MSYDQKRQRKRFTLDDGETEVEVSTMPGQAIPEKVMDDIQEAHDVVEQIHELMSGRSVEVLLNALCRCTSMVLVSLPVEAREAAYEGVVYALKENFKMMTSEGSTEH